METETGMTMQETDENTKKMVDEPVEDVTDDTLFEDEEDDDEDDDDDEDEDEEYESHDIENL